MDIFFPGRSWFELIGRAVEGGSETRPYETVAVLKLWQAGAQPFDPALRDLRMNRPAGRFTSSAPTLLLEPSLALWFPHLPTAILILREVGRGLHFQNLFGVAFAVRGREEHPFVGVQRAERAIHHVLAQVRRGLQKFDGTFVAVSPRLRGAWSDLMTEL